MYEQVIESLAYLHDATVEEIAWVATQESRTARLTLTCNEDCGHQEWNGRRVVVTCSDVLLYSSFLLGHVSGLDTFDSHSDALSPEAMKALQSMLSMGIARPNIFLRITPHSGSELQLTCNIIAITPTAIQRTDLAESIATSGALEIAGKPCEIT